MRQVQLLLIFVMNRAGLGLRYVFKEQQENFYLSFLFLRAFLSVFLGAKVRATSTVSTLIDSVIGFRHACNLSPSALSAVQCRHLG
jgi:hypothetical protein